MQNANQPWTNWSSKEDLFRQLTKKPDPDKQYCIYSYQQLCIIVAKHYYQKDDQNKLNNNCGIPRWLKGQSNEIFDPQFFHKSYTVGPRANRLKYYQFFIISSSYSKFLKSPWGVWYPGDWRFNIFGITNLSDKLNSLNIRAKVEEDKEIKTIIPPNLWMPDRVVTKQPF